MRYFSLHFNIKQACIPSHICINARNFTLIIKYRNELQAQSDVSRHNKSGEVSQLAQRLWEISELVQKLRIKCLWLYRLNRISIHVRNSLALQCENIILSSYQPKPAITFPLYLKFNFAIGDDQQLHEISDFSLQPCLSASEAGLRDSRVWIALLRTQIAIVEVREECISGYTEQWTFRQSIWLWMVFLVLSLSHSLEEMNLERGSALTYYMIVIASTQCTGSEASYYVL